MFALIWYQVPMQGVAIVLLILANAFFVATEFAFVKIRESQLKSMQVKGKRDWRLGLAACATWLLVAALTRLSSAGALAALALSPVAGVFLLPAYWWVAPLCNAALIFWRHDANIRRILNGTEPKIGSR